MKQAAKRILPDSIVFGIHKIKTRLKHSYEDRSNREKQAQDVFDEIYRHAKWGGDVGEINSGSGSQGPAADLYVKKINEFIAENNIKSVVDIGCGDFSIGSRLVCDHYTGVDVSKTVVERNNARFSSKSVRFICLDASQDDRLPTADLCLIRQVLQHLSNKQVDSILRNVTKFRFSIVTEHHPADKDFLTFNRDIVHGRNTRLSYGSGLYLDRPPFS